MASPPSSGDWIISGTESYRDQVIVLNGNLIIEDGGNLTFRNVTLKLNCAYDGQYGIQVKTGGSFYVLEGSVITAVDPSYEYYFSVGSTFRMNHSELHESGYEAGGMGSVGLTIESTDDAIVENSLISNNWIGIMCHFSSPIIRNNNISSNANTGICLGNSNATIEGNHLENNVNTDAILLMGSSPIIRANTITDNGEGIRCIDYSNPTILNNTITNNNWNGIDCSFSNPIIRNNDISSNANHGIWLGNSNATIEGNHIEKNGNDAICIGDCPSPIIRANTITGNPVGIRCSGYSNATILNNTIINHLAPHGGGIQCDHHSSPKILDNNISLNLRGIYCYEHADPFIQGNNITNNIYGIVSTGYSNSIIRGNTITSNKEDGISSMNYSNPTISNNVITNNSGCGVSCAIFSNATIKGNTLASNGAGIGVSRYSNPIIQGNNLSLSKWGVDIWDHSSPVIQGNTISSNWGGGISCDDYSNPIIQGNDITLNREEGIRISNGSRPEIHWNNIYGNGHFGVSNNDTTVVINATHNYWGNAAGPIFTDKPDGTDPEEVSANVTYIPWLTEPIIVLEITNPLEGAIVSGIIPVKVNARTVCPSISEVRFYLDNAFTHTDDNPPYEWNWNTTQHAEGPHRIGVTAYNNFGTQKSAFTTVVVDLTKPFVMILSPAENAKLGGTITVNFTASDAHLKSVHLIVENLVYDVTGATSFLLDTTPLKDGNHTLIIMAIDEAENYATTSVRVFIDRTPPTVSIQSPTSGATVSLKLVISVEASDASGVSKVDFYINDILSNTVFEAPYRWEWDTTQYDNGEYTIRVVAFDTVGLTSSQEIRVTIRNVKAPWWQERAFEIIGTIIAIGALIVGILTYKRKH